MAQKVDYAALKKGGYMRQKQKGYGSLRLAVVGGNLTAENIKTVAEVAEKYGRGYVHMTSRQGIEIPFIKVEELAEVKEALAKGGVGTGVCGPRQVWEPVCADHVYVQLQPVRVQRSVQADVSTPTHWQKSLMRDISDGNSRINSNLVLQDARITA